MVEITEITSDDGSNGGDPSKKLQEEENQNEKPQQQVVVQNHQNKKPKRQVQNLRIPQYLPEEIKELILTFLERCDYSSLLCISKAFRDIVTSPELFETRSRLGRTECNLYAFIGFSNVVLSRWFVLLRRNDSLRLSMIENQILPTPRDLPDELAEHILSLVQRSAYPNLSLINKTFHRVVVSPELFETRSRLGRTEHVLYAYIGDSPEIPRLYILHRRNDSLRLSMINSLRPMILGSAVVTIGHDIYIIGGTSSRSSRPLSNVFVIDSRFHTLRCLPKGMRRARSHAAAGVVDGKIYVIGGCTKRGEDWIEVFDVKKQSWRNEPCENPNNASLDGVIDAYVVMGGKIYMWNGLYCFSYEPRRRLCDSWQILSPRWGIMPGSCCVVDDKLYAIAPQFFLGYPIVVYDPMAETFSIWTPVRGVGISDLQNLVYHKTKLANFGGKLVVLGPSRIRRGDIRERDVWCIVIELERRENGDIWGNVESVSRVLSCLEFPMIELSRIVTL